MKPLFTVHAGEYLVGSHIERNYPAWNVWVPAKDTGIDLLVTDARNRKTVSIQVKFSKDFNPTNRSGFVQSKLASTGWWTHDLAKIAKSTADFWVFVCPSFLEQETSYVIIPPAELLRRLKAVHGKSKRSVHAYLSVTKSKRCWDSRGLSLSDRELLAHDRYSDKQRDYTAFLDGWKQVERKLK